MQLKNNLYKIIRKEGVGSVVNYAIELIPSCVIYAAHFPGEPITPGVCIVQMGKELVEELLSEQRSTLCKLMITKVKNVKFLSIISPNETLQLTYQVKKLVTSEDGTSVETQLIVLSEEKPMAKISLVLRTV
ncbi:MAG: hydroxymyristoyl-ACP dehydratase [Prevotella histicola]|uniref:hydroxymyristoyl-ACP dehydratase n=1 Tax=Prevotella histicola TaxID=470565 RepID=UPI001CAE86F5|nr:hydroxymyristoyl-ACP dehydratase [Prevotella histicola]MBF1394692.1 hydroxymyristoyl-ACP dehydratase [Prevotella histicola]